MVEINLNHVYRKYPDAESCSVTDFDLHIENQEFIAFAGPSDCGKSTTLRMIAGLEDINKGTLEIGGKIMNDVAPKDRNIVMVFRNYASCPHMSVHDNMAFGLKLRHYSEEEIDKKIKSAVGVLELARLLDRKPAALSGSQRQRVALGRAIMRDAPVFLMDEPLSNLDAKLRVSMRVETAKLHQNLKTTAICVAHDQTEAITLTDRIIIMCDGKIQQIGTPQEVYNRPINQLVAGFINSPQVNSSDVTYKDGKFSDGKGLVLEVSGGHAKQFKQASYNGKEVIFSVRSEDIHSEGALLETWPKSAVKAKVAASELLSTTSRLYLSVDGTEFVRIMNARDFHSPGQKITADFDVNKGHFLDSDTKKIIFTK